MLLLIARNLCCAESDETVMYISEEMLFLEKYPLDEKPCNDVQKRGMYDLHEQQSIAIGNQANNILEHKDL